MVLNKKTCALFRFSLNKEINEVNYENIGPKAIGQTNSVLRVLDANSIFALKKHFFLYTHTQKWNLVGN